jgi:hypothetical protein
LTTLEDLVRRLNGSVSGHWINVRGPEHGAGDRSLGVLLDPKALDGFRVHSFAGDDETECRAYVKSLIKKANGDFCGTHEPEHAPREAALARIKRAMALWQEGTSATGTPNLGVDASRVISTATCCSGRQAGLVVIGEYRQQFDAWENGETCNAPARQRGPDGRQHLHGAQGCLDAFCDAKVFGSGLKRHPSRPDTDWNDYLTR